MVYEDLNSISRLKQFYKVYLTLPCTLPLHYYIKDQVSVNQYLTLAHFLPSPPSAKVCPSCQSSALPRKVSLPV